MTKAKISEYDAVASNNTDVNGVNIAENCPPSGMNNMGREIMAALKRFQVGSDGDGVTVGGNLVVSGTSTVNTFTAGPVSATTLNTSGAVVFNDAGADVDFRVEGDTNANLLFVDASADAVGIGTGSPSTQLDVEANGTSVTAAIELTGTNSNGSPSCISRIGSLQGSGLTDSVLQFSTRSSGTLAERMRIDSSGTVGINNTNPGTSYKLVINAAASATAAMNVNGAQSTVGAYFINPSNGDSNIVLNHQSNAGTSYALLAGYYGVFGSTAANSILIFNNGNIVNTNNSYGPLSDLKLKQDIVDAGSQWDDLKAIRIRKFRLKNDPDGVLQIGVIAQELEEVSPGLVSEHPDHEMVEVPVLDDEGNPVLDDEGNPTTRQEQQATGETTKSVKATVLYMKAVKALQEAIERIETLEAKVAALENA